MSQAGATREPAKGPRAAGESPDQDRARRHARPSLTGALPIAAQLAALLAVMHELSTSVAGRPIFRVALIIVLAAAAHYLVPFRFKKHAFVLLSLVGGGAILADPATHTSPPLIRAVLVGGCVGLTLGIAVALWLIWRLRVPVWARAGLTLGVGGVLALMRLPLPQPFLPEPYWMVIGALFMFRAIVYGYDAAHARMPERPLDALGYFLMLPSYFFVLFPVVDYTTFKRSFYADDIHRTAQRGVSWMARGVVHLGVYRWLYHEAAIMPDEVQGTWGLLRYLFVPFMLYLNVSGAFHFIAGSMHLFGYRLPETNRNFLLSSSFTDYWRRINIYWKDFMVKVFYYPVYFRLRRRSETLALLLATVAVFVATTVLHGWQLFWLTGAFTISARDGVFWGTLGVLVAVTVLAEARRGKRAPRKRAAWVRALAIAGVWVTVSVLWSMWSSTSLRDWLGTVANWR